MKKIFFGFLLIITTISAYAQSEDDSFVYEYDAFVVFNITNEKKCIDEVHYGDIIAGFNVGSGSDIQILNKKLNTRIDLLYDDSRDVSKQVLVTGDIVTVYPYLFNGKDKVWCLLNELGDLVIAEGETGVLLTDNDRVQTLLSQLEKCVKD